jgi:ABC-type multidrug transport system ATPase subunit
MSVPVITAEELTLIRGGRQLCTGCTVTVPATELTVIVGPNGSGKTTLLETLAGLRNPAGGDVRQLVDPPFGYLPQRPSFRGGFTVVETLRYYRQFTPIEAGLSPEDALTKVGLTERGEDPVDALSGGMTRLFALAVALIGDPAVLLLDEPMSGLDPQMRDAIVGVLQAERDRGRAVVMVTHALETVSAIADHVVVLGGGSAIRSGSFVQLLEESDTRGLADLYRSVTESDL